MPLLLEGQLDTRYVDNRNEVIRELRDENEALKAEIRDTKEEIARLRCNSVPVMAVTNLRRHLSPLHEALKLVFGEMDAIVGQGGQGQEAAQPAAAAPERTAAVWQSWKQRLGGTAAKVIDALLLHGDLNTQQLAIATGVNRNTIPQYVMKLNKAGLINKSGGRFSLKQLGGGA